MNCEIRNLEGKLLRCDQLQKGNLAFETQFRRKCQQLNFNGYQVIFGQNNKCPEKEIIASCQHLEHKVLLQSDIFYYYPFKSKQKIQAYCDQSLRRWKDKDPKSYHHIILTKALKAEKVQCLQYSDFKLKTCLNYVGGNKVELEEFIQECSSPPGENTFFQMSFAASCDLALSQFRCENEVGFEFYSYFSNKMTNKDQFAKDCIFYRKKWQDTQSMKKYMQNLKFPKLARCLSKEVLCQQKKLESLSQYKEMYGSCQHNGNSVLFEEEKSCPNSNSVLKCVSKTDPQDIHFLYVNDESQIKKFKKYCYALGNRLEN